MDLNGNLRKIMINKNTKIRDILQILGTESLRNIIHPNIHVASFFSDFKETSKWLVSDMRFKNEMEVIKNQGGITIRVNRGELDPNAHSSETSLDNETFDFVIDNSGTIDELFEKVKKIYEKIQR